MTTLSTQIQRWTCITNNLSKKYEKDTIRIKKKMNSITKDYTQLLNQCHTQRSKRTK